MKTIQRSNISVSGPASEPVRPSPTPPPYRPNLAPSVQRMAAPPVYRPNFSPQVQRMAAPKAYIPNMASPVQQKVIALASLVRAASVPQSAPVVSSAGPVSKPISQLNQLAPMPASLRIAPAPPMIAARGSSGSLQPKLGQQPRSINNISPAGFVPHAHLGSQPYSGSVVQPSFGQYQKILSEEGRLSTKRAKRLNEGQQAILKTRAKLGAGAGNIGGQVVKSSGISFVTTNFVKKTGQQYESQGIGFLEAWAIAARRGSAGNCDEFAAVTYFYLLEMNTGEDISVVSLPDVHHHFVMIGDVNNPSADDAVVVDPWPAKGYAVLYDHWEYKGDTMKITLGPTSSTGQTPLKNARQTLNSAGHHRKAFDEGLKEEFGTYGTGKKMKQSIDSVARAGKYFWGNEHTLNKTARKRLEAEFARRRAAVTDPLSYSEEEWDILNS